MPDPSPPPRLLLLGPALWCGGPDALPVPAERAWQLLAWLAHRGDGAGREQVATLFWPGHGAEAARRNLRKVLHRLREHPGLPPLDEAGGQLRWPVGCDVREFDAALDRGDTEGALALWRGEPWSGLGAESQGALGEWLGYERTRLRMRWRAAALQAAEDALRAGEAARAAALAQRLLDDDALDEAALRLRLRALRAHGRQHDARAAYALFAQQLADTHGLEPAAETQQLLEAPAAAPVPRDDEAFVGRRREQRELAALMAQAGCRWVTIVGAGGTGKTTLLRHALPELAAAAGVDPLWVSFEDVPTPAAAAHRLAEALGLRMSPPGDALADVAAQIAGRRLLLALDNLEHLPDAARSLAAALAADAGVRVVVTSRMRLGVADEWLLPLQGLPWPGPEDADRAQAFDAVRLFNARARRHRPDFDAAAERLAVAQLCAAVEGLPLALTMAAAWTRQFAVADLVAELQRGAADVLHATEPGVAPRHLSMEACLEHSWQLLVPAERRVLLRLSVFRGGFTAEAARQVAGATLPLLAALVDKSLVQRLPDDAGRLALPPPTADFARRRVDAATHAQAERAHAEYFLQQLARFPPPDRAGERAAFYAAMSADDANVLQAWRHACAAGLADALAAATVGFVSHVHARAQFATGLAELRSAQPALALRPLARARLQCAQALLALNTGEFAYALEACSAALPVVRRAGDAKLVRVCLDYMAMVLLQTGRRTEARRRYVQALQLAERSGDRMLMANVLHGIAMIDSDAGRHAQALTVQRRAMALRAELGGTPVLIAQELGHMLRVAGQPQQAADEMRALIAACNAQTLGHERSMLLGRLAAAELDLGDDAAADAHMREAQALNTDAALPVWDVTLALLACRVHLRRQRLEDARQQLRHASAMVRRADAAPLTWQFAWHGALWLREAGREGDASRLLAALLRQPGLDEPTRRDARALVGRASTTDAPATELMTLVDSLLPLH